MKVPCQTSNLFLPRHVAPKSFVTILTILSLIHPSNTQTFVERNTSHWKGDGPVSYPQDAIRSAGNIIYVPMRVSKQDGMAELIFPNDATTNSASLQIMKEPNLFTRDNYGRSFDINGDTMVIGSPDTTPNERGRVYIWKKSTGIWNLIKTVNGTEDDARFGYAVAFDGNTVAIRNQSDVSVYDWNGRDLIFQSIVAHAKNNIPHVGERLTMTKDYLFVSGIIHAGTWNRMFVYRRPEFHKIHCEIRAANGQFPMPMGYGWMDERFFAVFGSRERRRAWVYEITNTSCVQRQVLKAFDEVNGDNFGFDVDMTKDAQMIVVGAKMHPVGGNRGVGAVYVFRFNGTDSWKLSQKLTPNDTSSDWQFGAGVTIISSTRIAVKGGKNSPSSVWVYEIPQTTPCRESPANECREVVQPKQGLNATINRTKVFIPPIDSSRGVVIEIKIISADVVETTPQKVLSAIDINVTELNSNTTAVPKLSQNIQIEFSVSNYDPHFDTVCVSKQSILQLTWTTSGCSLASLKSNATTAYVTCSCSHLTIFAVVQQLRSDQQFQRSWIVQNVVVNISFLCVFFALTVFTSYQIYRLIVATESDDPTPKHDWNMIWCHVELERVVHGTVLIQCLFQVAAFLFLLTATNRPIHKDISIVFVSIPYTFYFWMYFFVVKSWAQTSTAGYMSLTQMRVANRVVLGCCVVMSVIILTVVAVTLRPGHVGSGAVLVGTFVLSLLGLVICIAFGIGCVLIVKRLKLQHKRMNTSANHNAMDDAAYRVSVATGIVVLSHITESAASFVIGLVLLGVLELESLVPVRVTGLVAQLLAMMAMLWLYSRVVDRLSGKESTSVQSSENQCCDWSVCERGMDRLPSVRSSTRSESP